MKRTSWLKRGDKPLKSKVGLSRGAGLKRTSNIHEDPKRRFGLSRKKRLNPINRTRRERRFREAFGSPHRVLWMKSYGCDVPGCERGNVQCAHVKSRAAGGTYRDTVPLCEWHHAAQHTTGIKTFQRRYGIDLVERARIYDERYRILFPHLEAELGVAA